MKRYFLVASVLVFVLVLSGCSLSSSGVVNAPGSTWMSMDNGKAWEQKSKIDEKTSYNGDVLSIAISPINSRVALVGTREGGILRTEDGGVNWKYLNFQSEKVYGLDIDPINERTIYASGVWQKRGKVFKSFDLGESWKEIYTSPSDGPLVISLVVDRQNSNLVYASTSDNQVIKTTDGGSTWKNIFFAPSPILKVAIDRGDSNLIYCVAQGGWVFRSRNGGQDFENITDAVSRATMNNQSIGVIETDPFHSGRVYLAGEAGLLRSENAGNSWEKLETLNDAQNFPIKALTINPKNSNELIYGAAKALYKSVDAGESWATSQLETAKTANVIKYSQGDSNILYLGLSK